MPFYKFRKFIEKKLKEQESYQNHVTEVTFIIGRIAIARKNNVEWVLWVENLLYYIKEPRKAFVEVFQAYTEALLEKFVGFNLDDQFIGVDIP